jgi:hypothetical protein
MTRKWQGLFAGCLTIAVTATLCGQSDDWFQSKEHDFGNRWEGLFGQNQGSPAWELRSFLGNVESYSLDSSVNLRIKYYVPDSTEAFIKAQVINRTRPYLMQPKPGAMGKSAGWRDFGGWATKDVLMPKRIASRDLGVLVRLGADSEAVNTFAPALVYYSAAPKPIKSYRFDFFTARALKKFSFQVLGAKGYRRTYKDQPGTGDRGTMPIVFDAADVPVGWTRVLLSPEYESSGERLNLEWKFYNERLP